MAVLPDLFAENSDVDNEHLPANSVRRNIYDNKLKNNINISLQKTISLVIYNIMLHIIIISYTDCQ